MDETLKYYRMKGEGIQANVVLSMKPEQVEDTMRRCAEKGYTLEETERPAAATMINPALFKLHNYAADIADPWANVKRAVWDGPNCTRCANRFNSKFAEDYMR